MRKWFILAGIILLTNGTLNAKHLHNEKEYQTHWCNARGGIMEYKLNDKTRVDCLLPTMAVEVDFAKKWAECIGQALYYGQKTKRTPACVLITENPEKDAKFVRRLRYTVYNKKKIPEFKTFTITPDGYECEVVFF
mgnify:CR=1 FL=1